MPRKAEILVENNLVKGLVTEATALNFPENAAVEIWDCIPEEEGRVVRRPGFEYEDNYEFDNYDRSNASFTSYLWRSAAGDPAENLIVVQVGDTLYYYGVDSESISPGKETFTTDLDAKKITGATTANVQESICQFTQVDGRLYVVHPYLDPFYVEYNSTTPAITETTVTVKVRDLEGSPDDPYDPGERPTATVDSVDIQHLYNLWNQGWANDVEDNGGNTVNPVTEWDSNATTLPSNSDRWWLFKDNNNQLNIGQIDRQNWSAGEAAKGFFILDAFDMDRNAVTNGSGNDLDAEYSLSGETVAGGDVTSTSSGIHRPRAIAAFAGRLFYAGVNAEKYNNKIYFSQVLRSKAQSGLCYQKNDPCDENFADLLADDGGYIVVPEIATIHKLFPMKNSLIVFASNGVWAIQGSEGLGFSATDYSVEKITSEGAISSNSFVNVEGFPLWWNWNGIFTIGQDENSFGSNSAINLTDDTIQTFYDTIPGEAKLYAQGAYNPTTKIVQWVFSSIEPTDVPDRYVYNRVLNFNVKTKAFYPWTIDQSAGVEVQGIINIDGVIEGTESSTILDSSLDTVVDSGATNVTITISSTEQINPLMKYLCCKFSSGSTYSYTWAEVSSSTTYADWITEDGTGIEFDSYFISGYTLPGQALVESQLNYLNIYMNTLTNSSLKLSTLWDYVNTTSDKRWSQDQQCYKSDANHNVSIRRLKIRGKGQALQIRCISDGTKPFEFLGWSTKILVDTVP